MKKIVILLLLCFPSCGDVLQEANRDDWTPDVLAFEFNDIYRHVNKIINANGTSYSYFAKGTIFLIRTSNGGFGAIKITNSPYYNGPLSIDYISFYQAGGFITSGSTTISNNGTSDIDNDESSDFSWGSYTLTITYNSYQWYIP